jgi:hypothetical protein
MLVLGPVSSIFDFLTFFALLALFGAGAAMFQTGWFIESLATQYSASRRLASLSARPPGFALSRRSSSPRGRFQGSSSPVVALEMLPQRQRKEARHKLQAGTWFPPIFPQTLR